MVPGSFGLGTSDLAAIATLAPSRAARSAIARPMPREAPVMKRVWPLRVGMEREWGMGNEGNEGNEASLALRGRRGVRSEEHTSELQSLMRTPYAVICLTKKRIQAYIKKC